MTTDPTSDDVTALRELLKSAMAEAWDDAYEYSKLPDVGAPSILASSWLAERDAHIRVETLREAATALERRAGGFRHEPGDRHVRRTHNDVARWLRARARAYRIERGESR